MNQPRPRYHKGQQIAGRYLVHQALMGGMGEVYLCLDEKENLPYALKTFQGNSPDLADIFKREVASWISLEKHPNIVRCYLMEILDNLPFMELEWVAGEEGEGADLRRWLRHGTLDTSLALRFSVDIVRGLQHANQKSPGIVHRDLKPENVLVNQSHQAKITDFGLAIVAQAAKLGVAASDNGVPLGQSRWVEGVVGTPAYMPPEQWRGETDLDFRTDIYAIGCILFELLTGKWLYNGRTVNELRAQHLAAPLPPLGGNIPTGVQHILNGCLAKRREDRYERIDLLLDELEKTYEAYSGESLPQVHAENFTAGDYINRSSTFSELGLYEKAITDCDQALRLDPSSAIAFTNRASAYHSMGLYEKAITDCDQALRLDPGLAKTYNNRASSYHETGRYQRAIEDFDQALRFDPNYALAYSNRAASYNQIGQYQQAIADCDQALHLNPGLVKAYNNRGNSFHYLGQNKRAIEDFDYALRLDPSLATAYSNRGVSYNELGQYQRAIEDFDHALHLSPAYALAYNNRGLSYNGTGQFQQAIEDFDQALRLDPGLAPAYSNRGLSYANMGQYQRAIEDFDQALYLRPNHAETYSNRGASYIDLRQYQRAIEDFDQALRLDPDHARSWFNKGAALANIGRLQEALPCLEKAYALGHKQAASPIQQIRQRLGLPKMQPQANPNDPQAAFDGFQQITSLKEMRQLIVQFPILAQMIPTIEHIIKQQVPPKQRPLFEQQLAWLRQIVEGR